MRCTKALDVFGIWRKAREIPLLALCMNPDQACHGRCQSAQIDRRHFLFDYFLTHALQHDNVVQAAIVLVRFPVH